MATRADIADARPPLVGPGSLALSYLELVKPRISALVLATVAAGYVMAAAGHVVPLALFHLLLGTALTAAGANALNQFLEADTDALMHRTARRPIPSGRLTRSAVMRFGLVSGVAGVLYLTLMANPLVGLLGLATIGAYLLCYTPLKKRTSLATVVGAVPGATPPLIGWAGAGQGLSLEAWVLFSILFMWQLPHFLAIAWRWRRDYARAGYPMLTVRDHDGLRTARQVVVQSAGLLLVSLAPTVFGRAGGGYFFCAFALGCAFIFFGVSFAISRTDLGARRLFLASLAYLPLLLICLSVDLVM